jgi:hypothetical protein
LGVAARFTESPSDLWVIVRASARPTRPHIPSPCPYPPPVQRCDPRLDFFWKRVSVPSHSPVGQEGNGTDHHGKNR